MFTDDQELTPTGFKQSMVNLRKLWIPVLEKIEQ
jgi:hypothetical protein